MFLCLVGPIVVWMKCFIFEIHLNSIIKLFLLVGIKLGLGGGAWMFVFVLADYHSVWVSIE